MKGTIEKIVHVARSIFCVICVLHVFCVAGTLICLFSVKYKILADFCRLYQSTMWFTRFEEKYHRIVWEYHPNFLRISTYTKRRFVWQSEYPERTSRQFPRFFGCTVQIKLLKGKWTTWQHFERIRWDILEDVTFGNWWKFGFADAITVSEG